MMTSENNSVFIKNDYGFNDVLENLKKWERKAGAKDLRLWLVDPNKELYSNSDTRQVAALVAKSLSENQDIETLLIRGLPATDWITVLEALKKNTTVQTLTIDYIKESPEFSAKLVEVLQANPNIKSLNVGGIYDKEIKITPRALAEFLKTNTSLYSLELNNSSVTESTASAFSDALTTNTTLGRLDFGNPWGEITYSTARALLPGFKKNHTLHDIRFGLKDSVVNKDLEFETEWAKIIAQKTFLVGAGNDFSRSRLKSEESKKLPNLIFYEGNYSSGVAYFQHENKDFAVGLLAEMLDGPEKLSEEKMQAIEKRLPAIIVLSHQILAGGCYFATPEMEASIQRLSQLEDLLAKTEKQALKYGIHLNIPPALKINDPIGQLHEAHTSLSANLRLELEKYLLSEGSSPDKLKEYLKVQNDESSKSFTRLFKGNFNIQDLIAIQDFGAEAELDDSSEKRVLLQFANHSVIPHLDYFVSFADKSAAIASDLRDTKSINALSMALPKPTGGRQIATQSVSALQTMGALQPIKRSEAAKSMSTGQIIGLLSMLHDESYGPLVNRHHAVKKQALAKVEEFNEFFGGINEAIERIDDQLNNLGMRRDSVEFKAERAESISHQLKLLDFNSPDNIHAHRKNKARTTMAFGILTAAASAGTGVAVSGSALTQGPTQTVHSYLDKLRHQVEHEISLKSLLLRRTADPVKLRESLDKLDEEIDKLAANKTFLSFLTRSGVVDYMKSIYMVLPRVIAGENNIDALQYRIQREGYDSIESFLNDLRSHSPRLGEAMEQFVLGFANSNDLAVIVAEANALQTKTKPWEKVLDAFVEKAIKEHYHDQSRQASIVDELGMRNVIYTGHPFHSFNEVVHQETDAALKALMAGHGDFSLVGSNDVHQIFGFYLSRYGEDYFADPLDRGNTSGKHVQLADQKEMRTRNRQAIHERSASYEIPRVSSIFTEICAHEYLLSQGLNVVKDRSLASSPQALGALEMANEISGEFIRKLALAEARKQKSSANALDSIGPQIEGLIASTFVDFFSELGAVHRSNPIVSDRFQKVGNAYHGENYSLAHSSYTEVITDDAKEAYGLFLDIYQKNLEKYLEVATRDNKAALLEQLDSVKVIMKDLQISDRTVMPESKEARDRAHYRNHSLSNTGVNHSTWVMRAEAIHRKGIEIK